MINHNKFAALALTTMLSTGVLLTAPSAHAKSTFNATWNTLYPASSSLKNATPDGCQLCHATAAGTGRNAYGTDLDDVLPSKPSSTELTNALLAIEGDDSDNDPTGASNLDEINADTQPGWAEGDNPAGVIGDLDPVTQVADISVSPLSVDFGAVTVGSPATDTVTISNDGSAELTIDDLAMSGSSEFILFSPPATPFTVAPGMSLDVSLEYAPLDEGLDNGSLAIASDSPGEESIIVALAGTGVPVMVNECVPVVDPASLEFGSIEIGEDLTLTTIVTNNGTLECDIEAAVTSASGEFILTSDSMVLLAPGASIDVEVEYRPVDMGDDAAQLTLTFPDRTIDVPLSGSGIDTTDSDGDGVPDVSDNCILIPNDNQRDTDGDNYGNICDPDLTNDGIVNAADLGILKTLFFQSAPGIEPFVMADHADFNGDGVVNAADLGTLKTFFFKSPGPSCIDSGDCDL